MILVPRRGAARGQDHIRLRGAVVQPRLDRRRIVAHMAQVDGLAAPITRQRQQHRAVGIPDLMRRGGQGGAGHDLVPGGQNADAQRAEHLDLGDPQSRQQRQVGRAQPMARGQGRFALGHILARLAGVGAGLDRAVEGHRHAICRGVLLQHHGIHPLGQDRAGQDADRGARRHRVGIGLSGGGAAFDQRQPLRARAGGGMGKAIAVDGGIGARRVRPARAAPGGKDAPLGLCGGQGLAPGHRVQGGAELCQRLVHRHPVHPLRHGETIVAQARRGEGRRSSAAGGLLDPGLVAQTQDRPLLRVALPRHRVELRRLQRPQRAGQNADLRAIPDLVRPGQIGHGFRDQRGEQLDQRDRRLPAFERPHRERRSEPFAQGVQPGNAQQRL